MIEYTIRLERNEERFVVENLVREAFWNIYRPGCLEHYVLHCLREDDDFIPELNFVMVLDGVVMGQVMCMKAKIDVDGKGALPIMTLGPICILPKYQRMGYGKILLDYTLDKAGQMGFGAVCFEGNIDFYGKSGFSYASVFGIRYHGLPEGEDASFFLCKELKKDYLLGVSGEYATPSGYFVDESDCESYDKKFPPKVKMKLSGQIW